MAVHMINSANLNDRLEWLPLTWRPGMSLRRQPNGLVVGRFYGAELSSVFQPIVDLASGRRIGYEAFVRCHAAGEATLSPWSLFSLVADDDTLIGLDRLCRTLHVLNDPRESEDELLFLNVHGRLLAAVAEDHGRAFRRVLDALGKKAGRIVIEAPESASRERGLLSYVLANYRINGFQVAANVASLADVAAVLDEVRPNFLKADARHFTDEESRRVAQSQAGEQGACMVFTRVAHADELLPLSALPGVAVQGYAVSDPLPPEVFQSEAKQLVA